METYQSLGLMSGSSLDGIDLAYCHFTKKGNKWSFEMPVCESIPMPERWVARLAHLPQQSALNYVKTHTFLGHYLGEIVRDFVQKHKLSPDFIASHGHTIFHEPHNRMTSQIGDGAAIASITQIPTITNLRHSDVALGGQGAPIVPIGDLHLFSDYRFCLNLGGIANISAKKEEEDTVDNTNNITAFDIGGANQILNRLVQPLNIPYDKDGELARQGQVNPILFEQLNALPFFEQTPPKSLSNQWVQTELWNVFNNLQETELSMEDALATFCEHLAFQVAESVKEFKPNKTDQLLATGGGAFNGYLMERIQHYFPAKVVVPEKNIVDFKEALVMAFIGVLRWRKEVNVLSSVTGATRDSVNGAVYY